MLDGSSTGDASDGFLACGQGNMGWRWLNDNLGCDYDERIELKIPSGWARRGNWGCYLLVSITSVSRKFTEPHPGTWRPTTQYLSRNSGRHRLANQTTRWWTTAGSPRLQGLWPVVQSPTNGQSLCPTGGTWSQYQHQYWLTPTNDLGKETACTLSKFAADSTLVGRWAGGGRQSMLWRPGQLFGWASTGCQKRHEALEKKVQNPGTPQCSCCRVLGLRLGWIRRSSSGKDIQVLLAESGTGIISEPMWWCRIIVNWAVFSPDQVKGKDSCPLLGTYETMPGQLCVALGSSVQREKQKNWESLTKGRQDV